MIDSEYQKAVYSFITDNNDNLLINAVAGSGKTTTLLNSLKLIPLYKTVLFMAYNKSIADELVTRVPETDNIFVKTVHSFGLQILRNQIENVVTDNYKYSKLLRLTNNYFSHNDSKIFDVFQFTDDVLPIMENIKNTFITDEDMEVKKIFSTTISLCNLGRMFFIDVKNPEIGVEQLNDIARKYNIQNENGQAQMALNLILLGTKVKNVIDYSDMIFYPLFFNYPSPTFDFVFIDEAQDLNVCQRLLMQKAINPNGGRFVAVGDRKQAIYAFSGADSQSFDKLKEIPNTKELPLSICYRCAKPIIDYVKHLVPEIKHESSNIEGQILHDCSYNDLVDGDMVLCRNAFPLVILCMRLLSEGKMATIMGGEIGLNLIGLIQDELDKKENLTLMEILAILYEDKKKMIERIIKKNYTNRENAVLDSTVMIFDEKIKILEGLSKGLSTPHELIEKIRLIFSDKKRGIVLSTIHKAKGLEAERVYIIHKELMPSSYATEAWQIEQEQNLRYVAYTRPKKILGFISDFDAFSTFTSVEGSLTPPKVSNYVGKIGNRIDLVLEITNIKEFEGKFGKTKIYEFVDLDGNVFNKFGDIKPQYLIEGGAIQVGKTVSFTGEIREHKEFRGQKTTQIGKIY